MGGYALLFGLFIPVYFALVSRLPDQVPVRSIQVALRAVQVALRAVQVALRAVQVALRAVQVALRAVQVALRAVQVALRANGLEGTLVGQLACRLGESQSAASQHWRLFYPPVR